ncbi:MAG: hypothetical protein ABFS32_08395 [Bacteroidota bacterium]
MIKKLVFIYLIIIVLWSHNSMAQSTYSTYSILGIGDYIDPAVPAAMGMGGLGISNSSYWYLNNTNPALLYNQRIALFSAGVLAETKNISQEGFESTTAGTGNLNHIAMAFPLIRDKMSFSLGLQPFTSMNYAFTYDYELEGSLDEQVVILNQGKGGISSFHIAVGGVVYKGLSLGVKASYLFSSYQKESSSLTSADYPHYIANYLQRQSVGGFLFGTGVAYKQKIGEYQLGLGFIYEIPTAIDGKQFVRIEQRTLTNQVVFADTIVNNEPNKVGIPTTVGGGISFGKPQKWMLGFDYKMQDWSGLNSNNSTFVQNFTESKKYIFGGEYTPDAFDVKSYFKRITFRAGFTFEEKPYLLENKQISEFGINFGWTLPVARFSSLDFGVMIGSRGTTENNLVKEDFFKVYFGASFNDNRWFLRPKFN